MPNPLPHPLSFSALQFAPRAPAIVVTLINMHGDADAFTTHPVMFAPTEAGREQAAFLLQALELLPDVVARDRGACLEAMCARLAPKLGCAEERLVGLLEPLVRTDCRFDDFAAMPVAYTVELCDNESRVTRARFGGLGYRPLGTTHPSHLLAWA